MSDLRTAAQQALEALEYHVEQTRPIHRTSEAITALRAALAEPVQEPYAWMAVGGSIWRHKTSEDDVPLYTTPPQQAEPNVEYERGFIDGMQKQAQSSVDRAVNRMAEPVEPVAGAVLNEEGRAALVEHGREEWHCAARNARRLYTAPPQRKPLTQEEIAAEWRKASECAGKSEGAVTTSQFVQMFARAVERAHGIKENAND